MSGWIKILLSSVVFSTLASAALVWLLREWISARLKKSIQHEYDVKLEAYKAAYQKMLAENEIRFGRWHEEKAKAIKDIYINLADAAYNLNFLLTLENDPTWQSNPKIKENVRENISERFALSTESRLKSWFYYRLFLEDDEDAMIMEFQKKLHDLLIVYNYCMINNDIGKLQKEGQEIIKELDILMNTLRHQFQNNLLGKNSEK